MSFSCSFLPHLCAIVVTTRLHQQFPLQFAVCGEDAGGVLLIGFTERGAWESHVVDFYLDAPHQPDRPSDATVPAAAAVDNDFSLLVLVVHSSSPAAAK